MLTRNDSTVRTTLYAGDYERVTENGVTRHYYYLGNGAVYVRTQGGDRVLYALTDHLGSIVRLIDEDHNVVFDATYDAWGQQTVMTDSLGFRRGYTGHEMLPEFSLINMNGRLYDPLLGVFLSPDNYVQAPENSQSFNRYSYCLNNPLRFKDPKGDFWVLLPSVMIGAWGGEVVGSSIGLYIGGYGAVPIGIAGYLAGDYAGGELGAWAGEYIYDSYLR